MDCKKQTLILALAALRSYDQIGMIPNYKFVIREILACLTFDTTVDELTDTQDQIITSGMLMIQAIERAKKID